MSTFKQTKAVTMSHWARCDQHQQASEERVAQRLTFVASLPTPTPVSRYSCN